MSKWHQKSAIWQMDQFSVLSCFTYILHKLLPLSEIYYLNRLLKNLCTCYNATMNLKRLVLKEERWNILTLHLKSFPCNKLCWSLESCPKWNIPDRTGRIRLLRKLENISCFCLVCRDQLSDSLPSVILVFHESDIYYPQLAKCPFLKKYQLVYQFSSRRHGEF